MTPFERIMPAVFLFAIMTVFTLEGIILFRIAINKFKKNKLFHNVFTKKTIAVHILSIVGIICFTYGYFIEPYWIEVNNFSVQTEQLKNTSFKIVHISDLHCDPEVRNENKLAEIINPLSPDVIVFTGDCVNDAKAIRLFQNTLKSLNAKIGKYAVLGNWDIGKPISIFKDTGFTLLENENIKIEKNNEAIYLSGIIPRKTENLKNIMTKIPDDSFSILLYHYPDLIEDIDGYNVDLYLAGHTHGGQVALPFYGALITLAKHGKKYESGTYLVNDTTLYVNRGLGMEGRHAPRVRFNARPEIAVFDITPNKLK